MPIYEYQAAKSDEGCPRCRMAFEIIQSIKETPLRHCAACGAKVKKLISRCRGVVVDTPEEATRTASQIRSYEQSGKWSHAAELADTYAEKTKDAGLKARAMEDYRKAGHDVD